MEDFLFNILTFKRLNLYTLALKRLQAKHINPDNKKIIYIFVVELLIFNILALKKVQFLTHKF